MTTWRFYGHITGLGSTSGVRCVVGHWTTTPLEQFADVMIENAGGHRILLAPSREVADFICDTYRFDEVRLTPVEVTRSPQALTVNADGLKLSVRVGPRTPLGWLLSGVPRPLASQPWWCRAIDPVARRVLTGVRTAGQARSGRREYYGAVDVRRLLSIEGVWEGTPLGSLAPVHPPVRFGFSSTPSAPSMTTVVTTVCSVAN